MSEQKPMSEEVSGNPDTKEFDWCPWCKGRPGIPPDCHFCFTTKTETYYIPEEKGKED